MEGARLEAVRVRPEHVPARAILATLLAVKGEREEARQHFALTPRLEPSRINARTAFASLHARRVPLAEAREECEQRCGWHLGRRWRWRTLGRCWVSWCLCQLHLVHFDASIWPTLGVNILPGAGRREALRRAEARVRLAELDKWRLSPEDEYCQRTSAGRKWEMVKYGPRE